MSTVKHLILAFAILILLSPSLAMAQGTESANSQIQLNGTLAEKVADVLSDYKEFYTGLHQGFSSYAAEIECSSPTDKDDDSAAVLANNAQCVLRRSAGYSRGDESLYELEDHTLIRHLVRLLSDNGYGMNFDHRYYLLSGTILCDLNTGAAGSNPSPECRIER